jgi:hypothetical protein
MGPGAGCPFEVPKNPNDLGTAGPAAVRVVAPDGSWVVVAQSRVDTNNDGRLGGGTGWVGDEWVTYLIFDRGPGEPIKKLVDYDPSRRWLVVQLEASLVLVDGKTRARTQLRDADLDDDQPMEEHPARAAQFDASGRTLFYLRKGAVAVLRDLASGREREVALGSGNLWRAELAPAGDLVVAYFVMRNISDPHGFWGPVEGEGSRGDWPWVYASEYTRFTRGPAEVLIGPHRKDVEVRVARVGDAAASVAPGFLARVGSDWLGASSDGALVLHESDREIRLVPAGCDPRVWIVQEHLGVAVATCGGDEQGKGIHLVGRDVKLQLPMRGVFPKDGMFEEGRGAEVQGRVAWLPGDLFVDLKERRLVDEAERRTLSAVDGDNAPRADQTTNGRILVPAQADGDSWCGPLHWEQRRR